MIGDEQRKIALEHVKKNYKYLDVGVFKNIYADDKEFLREVIAVAPIAIRYASTRLRQDKELVLEAVRNNAKALKYVSRILIQDMDVCKAAVIQNPDSVEFMHWKVKANPSNVVELVKANPNIYMHNFYRHFPNIDMMSRDMVRAARKFLESDISVNSGKDLDKINKARSALAEYDAQDREKELLAKIAELDRLQAQQQNSNHQPRAEVRAKRKI